MTDKREELIDVLVEKPQHKISSNSQGGYDCRCGARWDWQKSEKEAAERHAAGYLADRLLAVFEQAHTPLHAYRGNRSQDTCWVVVNGEMCRKPIEAHTPTDDEREPAIAEVAAAFQEHEGTPTWQDDPVARDAALRWHMRGFKDGLNARRTVQGEPIRPLTPCGNLACTGCRVCGCPALGIEPQGEPTDAQVLAEVREHAQRWADRPPTSPYAMGLRDAWRTILRKIDGRAAAATQEGENR